MDLRFGFRFGFGFRLWFRLLVCDRLLGGLCDRLRLRDGLGPDLL